MASLLCFSPKNLRTLRSARDLSRTDLAAQVGVAFETLAAWEQSRSIPQAGSLAALSAVLGCRIDALFSPINENDPAETGPFDNRVVQDARGTA